jgi:hypothetical protein
MRPPPPRHRPHHHRPPPYEQPGDGATGIAPPRDRATATATATAPPCKTCQSARPRHRTAHISIPTMLMSPRWRHVGGFCHVVHGGRRDRPRGPPTAAARVDDTPHPSRNGGGGASSPSTVDDAPHPLAERGRWRFIPLYCGRRATPPGGGDEWRVVHTDRGALEPPTRIVGRWNRPRGRAEPCEPPRVRPGAAGRRRASGPPTPARGRPGAAGRRRASGPPTPARGLPGAAARVDRRRGPATADGGRRKLTGRAPRRSRPRPLALAARSASGLV